VEVHSQARHRHRPGDRFQHRTCLQRRADADGVAQRDLGAAHGVECRRHLDHPRHRHRPLVGAAEHAGDIATNAQAGRQGRVADRRETRQALGDGAVEVAPGEGFGSGGEDGDLPGAGGQRALQPLQVGHQHRVAHARPAADPGQHLGGIGHLRHPLGRHEGTGLDDPAAGLRQPLDKGDLHRRRQALRLVLQAVARPHLDDPWPLVVLMQRLDHEIPAMIAEADDTRGRCPP
jgi:hypothetical protein